MRVAPLIAAFIATGSLVALPSVGSAEDIGRYTIVPFDKGVVRVDRKTGATDRCRDVSGKLVCELAADERLTRQRETDSLSDTVSRLEKRITRLEREGLPQSAPVPPTGKAPTREPSMDSVEEMEKAWTITETFIRRFFNLVESLKSEKDTSNSL